MRTEETMLANCPAWCLARGPHREQPGVVSAQGSLSAAVEVGERLSPLALRGCSELPLAFSLFTALPLCQITLTLQKNLFSSFLNSSSDPKKQNRESNFTDLFKLLWRMAPSLPVRSLHTGCSFDLFLSCLRLQLFHNQGLSLDFCLLQKAFLDPWPHISWVFYVSWHVRPSLSLQGSSWWLAQTDCEFQKGQRPCLPHRSVWITEPSAASTQQALDKRSSLETHISSFSRRDPRIIYSFVSPWLSVSWGSTALMVEMSHSCASSQSRH